MFAEVFSIHSPISGCTIAYYREFIRHSSELLSRAGWRNRLTGASLTSTNPLVIVLSVFPIRFSGWLGDWVAYAHGGVLCHQTREQDVLMLSQRCPVRLLVAKKQVYYTFPMLVPLALLAGRLQLFG